MNCQERWAHYRKLRWQAFFAWLGGSYLGRFPGDLSWLIHKISGHYLPDWLYYALVGVCLVTAFGFLIFTWHRWAAWPCPRCKLPFCIVGRNIYALTWRNPFARKCVNCGLKKWTCPEEIEINADTGIVIRPRHEQPIH